jgi:ferrochelatase
LAKKRAQKVRFDYAHIGGKSPIYEDTETIAQTVSARLGTPVLTFHRYLPKTHAPFIESIQRLPADTILRVFPLFAQFSCATTGSIATWFARHLGSQIVQRMQWIKSYPTHLGYLAAFESIIREQLRGLNPQQTLLLFSAHGLPHVFIETGDCYVEECQRTFHALAARFEGYAASLCYQSQLGKKEWTRPYTTDVCRQLAATRKYATVVMIPLSFTSDHIETLFEIEELYLPILRAAGITALRCPALNQHPAWLEAIIEMLHSTEGLPTQALLRT